MKYFYLLLSLGSTKIDEIYNSSLMKEIIFNFWYLTDESELVYSLKAKPYIYEGTDIEKSAFLKERARYDYEVAPDYRIPTRFKVVYPQGEMNALPVHAIHSPETIAAVFEQVYKKVEEDIALFSSLKVSSNPYFVLTALYLDENGKVRLY